MKRLRFAARGAVVGIVVAIGVGGCGTAEREGPSVTSRATRPDSHVRWLVIAPHPDDEALIAAGVLARAVDRGERADVIVMTNGDYDCVHDGILRQGETVRGLAELGIPEARVTFLGYPDGSLGRLGRRPLFSRRLIDSGTCAELATTYGRRGRDGADYHRARFGTAAEHTRENVVSDLASLLDELAPTDVAITHPHDTHPDHAATYVLFRAALDRSHIDAPRVHRALVHNGDCWPTGSAPHEPCPPSEIRPATPMPPLTGRLAGYEPRERLLVPDRCFRGDPRATCKVKAIGAHASQTRGTFASYLFGFARRDEMFFPETLERRPGGWERSGSASDVVISMRARHGAVARSPAGEYELQIDASRSEATLRRGASAIATWPLPHDLFAGDDDPAIALRVDRRADDRAVEISLFARRELVGIAVDVSAFPSARLAR